MLSIALRRTVALLLFARAATRESELDTLLRAELFLDLHSIVKHSLRASVETYSLKDLEQFYGLARVQDLREASSVYLSTLTTRLKQYDQQLEQLRQQTKLYPSLSAEERKGMRPEE